MEVVMVDPPEMCFGLDLETDRRSLAAFVRRLASPPLLELLCSRMDGEEIAGLADTLTGVLKRHLSHEEYHRFFLGQ
jgi:hypothetical protein